MNVHNMGAKISEEQVRRQLVRFEHDLKDLYANYDKIDADWLHKAASKFGMFQRLDLDEKKHSQLPREVQKLHVNKRVLSECVPIKIRKLEQEAELAYRKLLDVNHDIPAVDYGQAFYDDAVYFRRHRKKE